MRPNFVQQRTVKNKSQYNGLVFPFRSHNVSAAETVFPPDTATSTHITRPARRRLIRAIWLMAIVLNTGIFIAGLADYVGGLHYGCLCGYTWLDTRDGAIIMLPLPNGPLVGLVQDGD